jgi:hypothetical protein
MFPFSSMSFDQGREAAALLASGRIKILRYPLQSGISAVEEVEKQTTGQGSQGPQSDTWIEIYLRDMDGQPVQGERYKIKLPDGSTQEGMLDAFGHAEYYHITPGTCQVCFPDLDEESWEKM